MAWVTKEPKFPAPRPAKPAAFSPDEVEVSLYEEGVDLDLLRRSYRNLTQDCRELSEIIQHVRATATPFTKKDLKRLDDGVLLTLAGLHLMRKVIDKERRWEGSVERSSGNK